MGGRDRSDGGRGRLRDRDRAQTVQDFAVGASVFLLTVSFVFAFVPSLFTPFESSVDPGASMQVERVSDQIIDDTQRGESQNYLRETSGLAGPYSLEELFNEGSDGLQNRYRLPRTSQINVTLTPVDSDDPVTVGTTDAETGNTYRNRPAASITRIVAVPGVSECDPADDNACELRIRIW